MSFIYKKQLSGDIAKLIARAKTIARKTGVTMRGNENSGTFFGRTIFGEINGSYTVINGVIKIAIHKKPFMVSEAKLVSAFDTYFS
jgi:hypothetical protein